MLHRTSKVRGFHILATDGEIGHVDDFLFEEGSWTLRYLVVDTSNWIGGKSVLIASAMIESIDAPGEVIRVRMTRDQVERSPSMASVDIELIETLPSVWVL